MSWQQRNSQVRAPWRPAVRLCERCGKGMYGGQQRRHFACDANAIEGTRCTCPRGCTDRFIGDGPNACDPECVPCRVQRGVNVRPVKDKL